ncbi:GGDEF domain-containing protein [Halopseudomonas salegens]|uniref:PAS domain S-box-containing protein/diguanylate cyclase (GGDEF) domain-containing protein n=1 Tax=Halopseudomonas salegens TaxID=1434072 RepID=A0A1H2GTQ4_9GAMM|nr:GGDEF domain-containing protein [Halopseudomonas salegens]SDU22839.1 PAS domain S-box-containing protein/diguanylate cyclase (GGDEF) domain-containing protein [Halopseudomonas salegens]
MDTSSKPGVRKSKLPSAAASGTVKEPACPQTARMRVIRQLRKTWIHLVRYLTERDNPWIFKSARVVGNVSFEDMAQITLDSIGDAVLVVDPQGTVIYLNKVAELLTGWSGEQALGRSVDEVFCIVDGVTRQRVTSPSQRAISEGRIVALALGSMLIRRDGTDMAIEDSAAPIHNRHGRMTGAVIVFHDARLSGSVVQEMSHLAQHDGLTGLPNRMLLVERLTQAIGIAKRHGKQVALMFLDLDHFKPINDSFGHAVGDHLLRDLAADMIGCVRATDTVSRHGGDEFVILLSEIEDRQDAALIAEKLLAKFAVPRVIDGHALQITLSIGISVFPDDGADADSLMLKADQAMYCAKNMGRNTYLLWHQDKR